MKIRTLLLSALLGTFMSSYAQKSLFKVKGELSEVKIPMKIYIYYRDGDKKMTDSLVTQKGNFEFSGQLDHATLASVYTHFIDQNLAAKLGFRSWGTQVMLEPGTTTSIKGKWMKDAIVTGGLAQQDYISYTNQNNAVGDSIGKIWKSQLGTLPEDSAASFKRLLYARSAVLKDMPKKFIMAHPNSPMSFHIVEANSVDLIEPDKVMELLELVRPSFGKTKRFGELEEKIMVAKKRAVGQTATNFSQADNNGNMVSLANSKGKFVLVDFWASWCGPCRAEYPHLKAAYKKYKKRNFEIIGISLDSKKDAWLEAIKENGFDWIQLSDLKGANNEVAKLYAITAIPQNFLIDPNGKIIALNLRGEQLEETLSKLF